jgi:hypothetical protein
MMVFIELAVLTAVVCFPWTELRNYISELLDPD